MVSLFIYFMYLVINLSNKIEITQCMLKLSLYYILIDIANIGLNCWYKCGEEQGPCDWCGQDGNCCKKGLTGNGCDGTIGGLTRHECAGKPGK